MLLDQSDQRKQASSHPPADQRAVKLPQPIRRARSGWGVVVEGEAYAPRSSDAIFPGMSRLTESIMPATLLFALQFGNHVPEIRHALPETRFYSNQLPGLTASAPH